MLSPKSYKSKDECVITFLDNFIFFVIALIINRCIKQFSWYDVDQRNWALYCPFGIFKLFMQQWNYIKIRQAKTKNYDACFMKNMFIAPWTCLHRFDLHIIIRWPKNVRRVNKICLNCGYFIHCYILLLY
jgi:hypothetical protein